MASKKLYVDVSPELLQLIKAVASAEGVGAARWVSNYLAGKAPEFKSVALANLQKQIASVESISD